MKYIYTLILLLILTVLRCFGQNDSLIIQEKFIGLSPGVGYGGFQGFVGQFKVRYGYGLNDYIYIGPKLESGFGTSNYFLGGGAFLRAYIIKSIVQPIIEIESSFHRLAGKSISSNGENNFRYKTNAFTFGSLMGVSYRFKTKYSIELLYRLVGGRIGGFRTKYNDDEWVTGKESMFGMGYYPINSGDIRFNIFF